ncbi:uncharacterized protein K452DRAFT_215171, partial [Aplosporella prunicola CBS 121167]
MLAIQKPSRQTAAAAVPTCTPNLLPCRVHHDGPVNAAERYWAPSSSARAPDATTTTTLADTAPAAAAPTDTASIVADTAPTAYFRGRKLRGKSVAVPEGWRGVVVQRVERTQGQSDGSMRGEEDEGEGEEEAGVMEEVGRFGEVVVWEQEGMGEDEDAYAKGLGEWVGFAEVV